MQAAQLQTQSYCDQTMDCLLWTGRLSKALTKHNMCDNLQEFQVQDGLELVSNQFGKGGLNVY